MRKQTAVEWLWLNLTDDMIGELSCEQIKSIYDVVQQAKAMEKEQIVKTYRDGRSDQQSERNTRWYNRNAEYYYNEKFKGGQDGC